MVERENKQQGPYQWQKDNIHNRDHVNSGKQKICNRGDVTGGKRKYTAGTMKIEQQLKYAYNKII